MKFFSSRRAMLAVAVFTALLILTNVSMYLIMDGQVSLAQQQVQTVQKILNDVWNRTSHSLMGTSWAGGQGTSQSETFIFNDAWDKAGHFLRVTGGSSGGGGSSAFDAITSGV